MTTPIVSPWLIYLANCTSGLVAVCGLIACFYFAIGLVFILKVFVKEDLTAEQCSTIKKISRNYFILGSLFIILTIFIPSSDTCYKIIAANMITYENVDSAKNLTKDTVDYIFEKIENLEK